MQPLLPGPMMSQALKRKARAHMMNVNETTKQIGWKKRSRKSMKQNEDDINKCQFDDDNKKN